MNPMYWAVFLLVVVNVGLTCLICWMSLAALRQLLFFHKAGRNMVQYELERASLDVEKIKAETAMKRVEADSERARADVISRKPEYRPEGSRISDAVVKQVG